MSTRLRYCYAVFSTGLVLCLAQLSVAQTIDWVQQLGGTGKDAYIALTRGPDGNLIAAGFKTDGSFSPARIRLTKFDADGNVIWQNISGALGQAPADICLGPDGNIYICGTDTDDVGGDTEFDGFVAKYDSEGNQLWIKQLHTDQSDGAYGLAVNNSGDAFVVGYSYGVLGSQNFGSGDIFIAKFDSDGNQLEIVQLGSPGYEDAQGIVLGTEDNHLYLCGQTNDSLDGETNQGSYDAFIAKLNQELDLVWIRQIGSTEWDEFKAITMDVSGRPVVVGGTAGSLGADHAGSWDAVVSKYDTNGNQLWLTQTGGPEVDLLLDVSVGMSGRIHAVGFTRTLEPIQPTDGLVSVFQSNGVPAWSRRINTVDDDSVHGVFATPVGEDPTVFVAGGTGGNLGGSNQGISDAFLAKISYGTIVESTSIQVVRGVEASGTETDIENSDDQYWRFNPGLTLSSSEPPVWLRQDVNLSFEDPATITLTLEANANTFGLTQEIEVFNWNTNQYDVVDQQDASFNNDMTVFIDLSGSTTDYVESLSDGSGHVLWQVKSKANGPILLFPWEYSIDWLACDVQ